MNVGNKTCRLALGDAIKKRLRRCKPVHPKPMRRQQARETLQHAGVVLNDSYGSHTMLIRIDRWRTLRDFANTRGQFIGPSFLKNCDPASNTR
jgi:hypothetical protein